MQDFPSEILLKNSTDMAIPGSYINVAPTMTVQQLFTIMEEQHNLVADMIFFGEYPFTKLDQITLGEIHSKKVKLNSLANAFYRPMQVRNESNNDGVQTENGGESSKNNNKADAFAPPSLIISPKMPPSSVEDDKVSTGMQYFPSTILLKNMRNMGAAGSRIEINPNMTVQQLFTIMEEQHNLVADKIFFGEYSFTKLDQITLGEIHSKKVKLNSLANAFYRPMQFRNKKPDGIDNDGELNQTKSNIDAVEKPAFPSTLYFDGIGGGFFVYNAAPEMTVAELKKRIQKEQLIPAELVNLYTGISRGFLMNDDKMTLGEVFRGINYNKDVFTISVHVPTKHYDLLQKNRELREARNNFDAEKEQKLLNSEKSVRHDEKSEDFEKLNEKNSLELLKNEIQKYFGDINGTYVKKGARDPQRDVCLSEVRALINNPNNKYDEILDELQKIAKKAQTHHEETSGSKWLGCGPLINKTCGFKQAVDEIAAKFSKQPNENTPLLDKPYKKS